MHQVGHHTQAMTTLSLEAVLSPKTTEGTRPPQVSLKATPPMTPASGPTASQQLMQTLREVPLLADLPESLIGLLSLRAQLRRYARDDFIVRQDGMDATLFVLRRGRAHVVRSGENDRLVLLDVLEPGALIGELSLIDGLAHTASVRCVQPCEVLALRGAEIMHCQSQCADFSHAWALALVRRLRESNQRIMSMSLDGVRDRVLWQLEQWSSFGPDGQRLVSARVGRNELARMVGASREMVCRVLRSLQSSGRIEVRADRSIVLRPLADT
jgi:CRP-like cAMP-binding protein